MISNKKQVLLCLLILFSAFAADARSIDHRRYKKYQSVKQQTPLLRQLDYDTITGTADDADNDADNGTDGDTNYETSTGTGTALDTDVDVSPTDAMVLLKPTQTTESGRLFGGFFIRAILRGGGGGIGGGSIPYIIVNAPNNITNVNQNSLNNTASATTTTTTTTTTTAAPGTRQQVFYQSFPQSSDFYQRRGSNPLDLAQNFMLSPGNQLIPIYLPPEVESLIQGNFNRPSVVQRRRGNNQANQNPFSAFTNNFKRVQYL